RVFTTLGSNASKNITFSASPAVFTFNNSSMTEVSGWPGATPIARFKSCSDTVSITPGAAGNITLTADIATSPPADTSITIVVNDTSGAAIYADSLAVANDNVASGEADVEVLRFYIVNGQTSAINLQTVIVKNDGTHPDTGISSVRIVIDTNSNGVYDAGDYNFGAPGTFTNGSLSRTDSTNIAPSATANFLVLYNMSPTLTVDSKTLKARIETGAIQFTSGDTACTRVLSSNGSVVTNVNVASGSTDSVYISGGSGIANNIDTAIVVVSVLDTNGVPASGRSVQLTGDTNPPITVVSSNPQTTGASGIVRFELRTGTPNTYVYSATVVGTAIGSNAAVTFLSENKSSGNNLGGNPASNIQQSSVTGAGKYYLGNVAFGGDSNPNLMAYVKADGTNWQMVKEQVGGAPTVLFQHNLASGQETGQVNFLSDVRVASTIPDSVHALTEYALCGVITRAYGRRAQIYAVDLATGDSIKITPSNPADTEGKPFQNIAWRWFDMAPNGETVATVQDGNLVVFWRQSGVGFDNYADSARIRYLSGWDNMYTPGGGVATNTRYYACYPVWSPDGKRLAFTIIYVSDNLPNGPSVTSAELYVLKSFNGITLGGYPVTNPYPTLVNLNHANLVKINTGGDTFPIFPQWTRSGDGLIYTAARGPDWDWQRVFKGYPNDVGTYDTSLFVTRFVYYDRGNDTTPNSPIDVSSEEGTNLGSMFVAMSKSGPDSFVYVRKSVSGATRTFELRTIGLGTEATVSSQGGVLFDSGHITVIVPASESYAQGFKIASGTPDTTPTADDSVIITGAAKRFYSPSNPSDPVYFDDSITVVMYYDASDFTETELLGYDSDGDGIPDRTEAAVSAYYWNGSHWVDYRAVRYSEENRIEFLTKHFSKYAVGLPQSARALAFNGTVQEVVAYPNPWRSDNSATSGYSSADERYGIKLTNFPGGDVRIRVFTLSGELVTDGTVNALTNTTTNSALRITSIINTGRGTVSWNLSNQSGRQIASGVYLIILDGPGGRAVRKVAVIR
ncbi:MAG: hypothetical protein COS94_03605, partial [Candidatus Hydrogenedentes bacterium CG07_land_8_20_14_0_80_42_17]